MDESTSGARLALLEPAEEHFTAAIELHGHDRPFERARTELLYGEWLRRARRRMDARPHLALAEGPVSVTASHAVVLHGPFDLLCHRLCGRVRTYLHPAGKPGE